MRQSGVAAASPSQPRRERSKPSLSFKDTRATPNLSDPKPVKAAAPASPTTRTPKATSSIAKRPSYALPAVSQSKPSAKPRPSSRSSPSHSVVVQLHSQHSSQKRATKPIAEAPAASFQVWSFDEKEGALQSTDGECKEEEVRSIPLSALFDWSASSSVLSFQSLSTYTLPPLPSYNTIPALCDTLAGCDSASSSDALCDAVRGLREFGASDLLASPHVSLVLSSLVSVVLLLREAVIPAAVASLLLLADLFDAAHSSHAAAELYLLLLQHVVGSWQRTPHWPSAQSDLYFEDEPQALDAVVRAGEANKAEARTARPSHVHLMRVLRFITLMQFQLPTQWVYCPPATHRSIVEATLQLHATALSAPAASLLSPAHMLAVVDPSARWLPLWLHQLPTRKLLIRLLASAAFSPLLQHLATSCADAAPITTASSPTARPPVADASHFPVVSNTVVHSLVALQRATFVLYLMQHASGRAQLRSAWTQAGRAARSEAEVRAEVQRLRAAALSTFTAVKQNWQPENG